MGWLGAGPATVTVLRAGLGQSWKLMATKPAGTATVRTGEKLSVPSVSSWRRR